MRKLAGYVILITVLAGLVAALVVPLIIAYGAWGLIILPAGLACTALIILAINLIDP